MDQTIRVEGLIVSCVRRGGKTRMVVEINGKYVPTDKHVFLLTDPSLKTLKQLNFFYAICKDIGKHIGEHFEDIKASFKKTIGVETLKYATRNEMIELIELAIEFCKKHEIPLSKKTIHQMDADKHVDICLHYKVCLLCGKAADSHHVDVIGMGRDRVSVDIQYPYLKKIPLCREHHTEVEASGVSTFIKKHHLEDYKQYFERSKVDNQSKFVK